MTRNTFDEMIPLIRTCFRAIARATMYVPVVRDRIYALMEKRGSSTGFGKAHPFDRRYGVSTSGFTGPLGLGNPAATAYGAAQPSIVRRGLAVIPQPETLHFIDIGCGKGRPLLIASQAGFGAVTGVELNPPLVRIARRNAAAFARAGMGRTPIAVVQADATTFALPRERLVLFFYNPFSDAVMTKVVANIEASLAALPRDLFVVAYNPVSAALFDASPALDRFSAEDIPCADEERGFGPSLHDAVVIWCNRGNPQPHPPGNRLARVRVLSPMAAELVDPSPSRQAGPGGQAGAKDPVSAAGADRYA